MTSILPMHDAEMTFWGEGGGAANFRGNLPFLVHVAYRGCC